MSQAKIRCARCGGQLIRTPDINMQGTVVAGRQWCENHRCSNSMQVPISPLLHHWLSCGELPEDMKRSPVGAAQLLDRPARRSRR
ncbi:hypothetical protein Q2941_15185 [Bradyrhizobium sp. UFLA05-153]